VFLVVVLGSWGVEIVLLLLGWLVAGHGRPGARAIPQPEQCRIESVVHPAFSRLRVGDMEVISTDCLWHHWSDLLMLLVAISSG
jgi:hypothetical protein